MICDMWDTLTLSSLNKIAISFYETFPWNYFKFQSCSQSREKLNWIFTPTIAFNLKWLYNIECCIFESFLQLGKVNCLLVGENVYI